MNISRFDVVLGNPPYQENRQSATASRRIPVDIFPHFQEVSISLAAQTSLIYPATWHKDPTVGLGATLRENGLKQSEYYDSSVVFPAIYKGYPLTIVTVEKGYVHDVQINDMYRPRFEAVWVDSQAKAILLDNTRNYPTLHGITHVSNIRNIADSGLTFHETSENLTHPVAMYIKLAPGMQNDGGWRYIERAQIEPVLSHPATLDQYTVALPTAPIGRMRFFHYLLHNRLTLTARVFGHNETHSQTYAQLKSFDTFLEAEHFAQYVNTHFFNMLTSCDFSRASFASYVPDLVDYSDANPHIDWDAPLEPQLYTLFGLTEDEAAIVDRFPNS